MKKSVTEHGTNNMKKSRKVRNKIAYKTWIFYGTRTKVKIINLFRKSKAKIRYNIKPYVNFFYLLIF